MRVNKMQTSKKKENSVNVIKFPAERVAFHYETSFTKYHHVSYSESIILTLRYYPDKNIF